eukprot:3505531-Lingulodinium_polyedra.AAC.1
MAFALPGQGPPLRVAAAVVALGDPPCLPEELGLAMRAEHHCPGEGLALRTRAVQAAGDCRRGGAADDHEAIGAGPAARGHGGAAMIEVPLVVATANVLSLSPAETRGAGATALRETGRMQHLQRVLAAQGVLLCGIQEARLKPAGVRPMA